MRTFRNNLWIIPFTVCCILLVVIVGYLIGELSIAHAIASGRVVPVCTDAIANAGGICVGEPR